MNIDLSLVAIAFITLCSVIIFITAIARLRNRNRQIPHEAEAPELGNWQDVPLDEGIISGPRIVDSPLSVEHADEFSAPARMAAPEVSVQQELKPLPRKIIALHVMAQAKPFAGYELLQTLLGLGLRYGEMNIFHRHQELSGRGKVLFSLASATEPGTFNIDTMTGFSCLGLTLFMDIAGVDKPMVAFNILLETARQLARKLHGVVQDESRRNLTEDKIAEYKQSVRAREGVVRSKVYG